MLAGQPNLSLPTDTYCTTAINHSPFGHQEETDNCPESPKASHKARPRLGCLPPAALSKPWQSAWALRRRLAEQPVNTTRCFTGLLKYLEPARSWTFCGQLPCRAPAAQKEGARCLLIPSVCSSMSHKSPHGLRESH